MKKTTIIKLLITFILSINLFLIIRQNINPVDYNDDYVEIYHNQTYHETNN